MTTFQNRFAWAIALGVMSGSLVAANSAFAEDKHGDAHGDHDHSAMQAEKKISDRLKTLPPADQKQALAQRFCPMMERSRLGSMGAPVKVVIEGKPVFVCCKGCVADAQKHGKHTLEMAQKLTKASVGLAKLSAKDRAAAEGQKYCAVQSRNLLGAMGSPVRITLNGKPVLLCCKGCVAKAQADPAATLAKVEALHREHRHATHMREDHKNGHHQHKE